MNSLIALYRASQYCKHRLRMHLIPNFLYRLIRVIFSCELPYNTTIGRNTLFIHNGLGCVVHPKAVIGNDCRIYQNVTIGGRNGSGAPIIGNNVTIYAGACVLGGIHIGDNAQIGANAVVISDVAEGAIVGGVPAKLLKKQTND